ncbi:MAG: PIG-L family deacetylase [Planctomycetota bacterium]
MLALLLSCSCLAQPPSGAVAFRQARADAGTDAIVLNVAAHPDDEAARTLVYLRRTLGVRTVALFTTCGEGGQNAVGRDIGQALAKRRVLETMAAAEHTGLEVRWLGFADFGFSKTLAETLKVWGADALEAAMLDALRDIGPDVVLTNHDTEHGHGHHRASAWAIQRALATYAREIGHDVPLYQRPPEAEQPSTFELEVGRLDAVAGVTFARQAYDGLVEHASQGPWGPHDPARVRPDRWQRVGGESEAPAGDPFARLPSAFADPAAAANLLGVDVGTLSRVQAQLASLRSDRPTAAHLETVEAVRPRLAALVAAAPDDPSPRSLRARLQRRLDALDRVGLYGRGIAVEAFALRQRLPLFGRTKLRVAVHADDPAAVTDLRVTFQGKAGEPVAEAPASSLVREIDFYLLPPGVGGERQHDPVTGARWLQPTVTFQLAGTTQTVHPRVRVLPLAELEMVFDRDVCVLPRTARDARRVLSLSLDYHGDDAPAGGLRIDAPAGVECELRPHRIQVSHERRDARVLVRMAVADAAQLAPDAALVAHYGTAEARLPLRAVDVTVPAHARVGVVRGPDDTLLRTLEDLGIAHAELDEPALAVVDLSEFGSIVLDMRTAGSRADLHDHRDRLLEFCANGGRVLAFYHKPREWNARDGRPSLAPYELVVGGERVCEEDVPVEILAPQHPLLTQPHAIGAAEFAGWQQERGLNFPQRWGPEWQPLLRMADTGEKAQDGSLLVAPYGKGTFVYCSLALYRQWRVGHTGALRLLVNLLGP